MQENNFERSVREKMEALRFTPTDPVWAEVEKRIRQKKERRRAWRWLPLCALLVGGGWWLWADELQADKPQAAREEKVTAASKDNNPQEIIGTTVHPAAAEQPAGQASGAAVPATGSTDLRSTGEERVSTTPAGSNSTAARPGSPQQEAAGPSVTARRTNRDDQQPLSNNNATARDATMGSQPKLPTAEGEKAVAVHLPAGQETLLRQPATAAQKQGGWSGSGPMTVRPFARIETEPLLASRRPDLLTSLTDTAVRTHAASILLPSLGPLPHAIRYRWRLYATAGGGASGIGQGLSLGGAKSADDMYSSPPVLQTGSYSGPVLQYERPAPIEEGPAFFLGAGLERLLSPRISVRGGLQYAYFSTRMLVGASQSRTGQNYSGVQPNARYLASPYGGTVYTNRFHFVELPVALALQPARRLPVALEAGLNFSRLLSTNALSYHDSARMYFSGKDQFNKYGLSLQGGLTVRLWERGGRPLTFGPMVRYSFGNLELNRRSHLYQYGLQAWMQLK